MAVRNIRLPYNTLADVVDSKQHLTFYENTSFHEILRTSKNMNFAVLNERSKHQNSKILDYDDLIKTVLEDSDAVAFYSMDAYKTLAFRRPDLAQHKCLISISNIDLYSALPSFILTKNSPYLKNISKT